MLDPADPQDEENLSGGWYELAVELDAGDPRRVDEAVRELSRLAGVESVESGHVLCLPDGHGVVCTSAVIEEDTSVWVVLGVPLGALARVDPRVGGYPFSDDQGHSWRRPLDDWLAAIAVGLFDVLPFRLALVGFEASGVMSAAELAEGVPVDHGHVGIIVVTDRPDYHPATA